MNLKDLDYNFPLELIAQTPARPSRVAFVKLTHDTTETEFIEQNLDQLIDQFQSGDVLVLNDTKVIPARIFSLNNIEILFLKELTPTTWQVLFPARDYSLGQRILMPDEIELTLEAKGLPQVVSVSKPLTPDYFEKHGEFALPPYIQQARGERHNIKEDGDWYQSAWAEKLGSVAAPTASLHFNQDHLAKLEAKGVILTKITLHVGAGTFLPVKTENLNDHVMHEETVLVPAATLEQIKKAKARGSRVWALGTTVTRALESLPLGLLQETREGFFGQTRLFITPGFQFQIVDGLLTNFHQPKSTLLALVAAFAGLENVKHVYHWAIERKFKLFSYGDLSAWIKLS